MWNKLNLIVAALVLAGCQTGSSTKEQDYFQLLLKLKTCAQDEFQLFYLDQKTDTFSDNQRLRIPVSLSDSFQEILFQVPIDYYPPRFRIDLGEHRQTCFLEVDTIEIKFRHKKIIIPPRAIQRYFDSNIYLELEDSIIRRFPVKGRYDPILYSSPLLEKEMYLRFQLEN